MSSGQDLMDYKANMDRNRLKALEELSAKAQKLGVEAFKFSTNDEMLQAIGLKETV